MVCVAYSNNNALSWLCRTLCSPPPRNYNTQKLQNKQTTTTLNNKCFYYKQQQKNAAISHVKHKYLVDPLPTNKQEQIMHIKDNTDREDENG